MGRNKHKQLPNQLIRVPDVEAWLQEASCSEIKTLSQCIIQLLQSPSVDMRIGAARAFGRCGVGGTAMRQRFPEERNEIVAAEILEALRTDQHSRGLLRRVLATDPRYLARIEAAYSLGMLGHKADAALLRTRSKKENSRRVRVAIYGALIRLGDLDAVHRLLTLLDSRDYVVRCAVANTLADLELAREPSVAEFLRDALDRETTVAARSSLEAALIGE